MKIRFAVIGCGHIGKRHAEMISREPDTELAALCDTAEKDSLGIEKLNAPFFSSPEKLFASGLEFDTVNICTPNGLHAQQALLALENRKHVVCEKPMGLHKQECEQMIHKALQVNKQIFCVMQNRYSPPSVWLKEIVEKKIIGEIFIVQLNCYWNRDERYYRKGSWKGTQQLDGGTLFTQFSHWIDLLYWLFGDFKDIQAKFSDLITKRSRNLKTAAS